jgi:predicted 2-oxoglutarate/Fe(II)-dependent dioxygenase YbiX
MVEYDWISDEIFTLTGFLEPDECASYIHLAETLGFEEAPIETFLGPAVAKGVRNNSRVILDDPSLAQSFWERSEPYIPATLGGHRAVGVNERFRFYRYDSGQTFRWHRDGAFERPNGERSRITLIVYLNEDFEGGETRFENAVVKPATGLALFFIHQLPHEGASVTRGRKYVLRTDVMYSG